MSLADAFATLGITPDTDVTEATKVYKRLALRHHPDRNHGDPSATQRFQQISAAWNICQSHYAPDLSYDDYPLDEDDLYEFYMFMFAETLFNRYSRTRGQRYRYERSQHARGSVFTFSETFAESQSRNVNRQIKEKEEYERRKKELELEIEEEERERERQAKRQKAEEDRLAQAHDQAFQTAYSARSADVKKAILEFDLDVNAPRNLKHAKHIKDHTFRHESLLHVAASRCDESLFMFLLERGANPLALNKQQLSPFHAAIKGGNTRLVRFIMEQRGKAFQSYHPSKATDSGTTPLQLAIESGNPSTVDLLVKHATTHDVERCWKQGSMSEEIKDVLRMKKGFVPPGEGVPLDTITIASKKAQRKLGLTQQREAQLAEEARRAEINRKKREERAAKRAIMEAEKAARQEEEERLRLQEERRLEVIRKAEERRAAEELEKAEADAREKAERVEAEARLKAEADARKRAERAKQLERERVEREAAKQESANIVNQNTQEAAIEAPVSQSSGARSSKKKPGHPKVKLSEEERKEIRRAKQKEKRHAKKMEQHAPIAGGSQTLQVQAKTEPAPKASAKQNNDAELKDEHQLAKHEAAMRRRAEQSARDKERHRRMVEERKKAKLESKAQEYIPPTPVSTHTSREPGSSKPRVSSLAQNFSSQLSFDLEDIQTCIVPEDLFRDERNPPQNSPLKPAVEAFAQTVEPFLPSPSKAQPKNIPSNPEPDGRGRPHRHFYRHPRRGRAVAH